MSDAKKLVMRGDAYTWGEPTTMAVCNCIGPQDGDPACPCAMNAKRMAELVAPFAPITGAALQASKLRDELSLAALRIAKMENAIRSVIATMDKSDSWWIDCPDRGGFDRDALLAALEQQP